SQILDVEGEGFDRLSAGGASDGAPAEAAGDPAADLWPHPLEAVLALAHCRTPCWSSSAAWAASGMERPARRWAAITAWARRPDNPSTRSTVSLRATATGDEGASSQRPHAATSRSRSSFIC